MSRPIVECTPSAQTRRLVEAAWAEYHRSVQEYGPSDEWDRKVIDQAIRAMVKQGENFSVNDFRDLLPEVRKCLISRRLIAAQKDGLIEFTGVTYSSLKSTKGAKVNIYRPVPGAEAAA
ncbi:hypothetical protein C5C07_20535 [Haloferax sp. Atlit-4N]|uniref:hypothetical protein n=1 Tax=Haloferax sp. Atlit-4N TaxID=2077206 RepID=UPI000E26A07B|nr:hypothetical protein [Haloferax sp. Atlit-4N]RDZ48795.1 hypothetical protein C5C07_20535 [Haloferax sp. Atlit-4N]